eukprot:1181302-Prorocentrum_minimum.AAC.2
MFVIRARAGDDGLRAVGRGRGASDGADAEAAGAVQRRAGHGKGAAGPARQLAQPIPPPGGQLRPPGGAPAAAGVRPQRRRVRINKRRNITSRITKGAPRGGNEKGPKCILGGGCTAAQPHGEGGARLSFMIGREGSDARGCCSLAHVREPYDLCVSTITLCGVRACYSHRTVTRKSALGGITKDSAHNSRPN